MQIKEEQLQIAKEDLKIQIELLKIQIELLKNSVTTISLLYKISEQLAYEALRNMQIKQHKHK